MADLRDEPTYLAAEASCYLGVPVSTVRSWAVGHQYRTHMEGVKRAPPAIRVAQEHPLTLSFWNLVELYILASIRRRHGVPFQRVRPALQYVESKLGVTRPLIHQEFLTDGADLFVDQSSGLINVSDAGQMELRKLIADSLERIAADTAGLAARLYPWLHQPDEPHFVEIDPHRGFGRLVVTGTGIPTEALAERFRAGDSVSHLAADYNLSVERIEAALRWEHRGAAA